MLKLPAVLFVMSASVAVAQAQERSRPPIADSSASLIMKRVGARPGAVWLRDILRQASGPQSQAKLDELADSLVARAMDPASGQKGSQAYVRASQALQALTLAGSRGPWHGRPYVGLFDRLVSLQKSAPSHDIRWKALGAMLVCPCHPRAVEYLSAVAESEDSTAYNAIQFLITDANGGSWVGIQPTASQRQVSAAALKALANRGRVTDIRAGNLLEGWIQRHR